jgi:hypothetical protein
MKTKATETTTRGVISDMLMEFAQAAEKLARQLQDGQ